MSSAPVTNVQKVEDYKTSVIKKGEEIVRVKFPEHILLFNKLLEESPFLCDDLSKVHTDLHIPVPKPYTALPTINHDESESNASKKRCISPEEGSEGMVGTKVFLLPLGSVPINVTITEMIDTIKPFIRNLVEESNLLKMWISFLIPKIEDGNNFGVSIQEETLEEIRSVESEASVFYEQIARYYLNRAKLVSKVGKYPHIADYRRAVIELDEKQFVSLRVTLAEIRNHYASLHDMINKNLEKIKKPRSINSHEAMY